MIYLETAPSPPLAGLIRSLWYASAPEVEHQRERVLPNGCMQIVITLAADALTDCGLQAKDCTPIAPAIVVGARSRYEVIATRDFAEIVGVIFRPGGLGPWLRQSANAFFEQSVPLENVWSNRDLRTRLREANGPSHKLLVLDRILRESLHNRSSERRTDVRAALFALRKQPVREAARSVGLSERRLQQLFLEDVGLSPKLWSRVQRFQRALKALHDGDGLRWEQLALDCGYYDQSHFSNDFQAFSGINPTTYCQNRGPWRNHVVLD